ncbi:MAG TPA: hypothetical protein ENH82_02560 [bacterium]|nr:hypothetical protein [bacterium]
MKTIVTDSSMHPYLKSGDIIKFKKGNPVPNGCICLVRYWSREKIIQVFKEVKIE